MPVAQQGAENGPSSSWLAPCDVGGLRLRWERLAAPVDATVKAVVHVASVARGLTLGSISRAIVSVTRAGVPVAVITGTSRGSALWPLSVDARVADAGRLAPWLPFHPVIAGSARNRERAPAGTWIQGEAGDWLRK